eukprot:TRINITY_DN8534_c0_g2_i2.p1 TRINITY_DN8534_c0_g2~~TRINITY_DN8534_c0_g2_i2.p1  ORF type:complete len:253 (-),score=70.90 TRINITY_DN8534_c0_g2_i2:120-878(-)
MDTLIKIGMVVGMIMMTKGEASEDLENVVKEIRLEMNQRFALNEEKTQRELLELRFENIQLKEDLIITKKDLANTKDNLENTNEDLANAMEELTNTKEDLIDTKLDVSFLKEPPFFHACGYQYSAESTGQTIPYSHLLYSSTNTEEGGLDTHTGIFTSPFPGSYTITWSLIASDHAGDNEVWVYLRKNGQEIEESRLASYYGGSSGWVHNLGGRGLVMHLDRGDTLDLYCEDCSAEIYRTTFCVSLSTYDNQ